MGCLPSKNNYTLLKENNDKSLIEIERKINNMNSIICKNSKILKMNDKNSSFVKTGESILVKVCLYDFVQLVSLGELGRGGNAIFLAGCFQIVPCFELLSFTNPNNLKNFSNIFLSLPLPFGITISLILS